MRYSIITATKNAEDQIENSIKSVLSQNNVDLEHIIIDSVSKDNTIKIIDKYSSDQRIKYISEKDNGISDAFNKGIKLSSGEWIIFLGAGDTFIHNKVLSDISKILINKSSELFAWGNIVLINARGEKGKTIMGKNSLKNLKRYMSFPHQAIFHNRELFQTYGMYDTNLKVAMDYDLLLRCFDKINSINYINYNVSYMLIDGLSQNNAMQVLKEFYYVKIKNNICSQFIAYSWLNWARVKYFIKKLINYDSRMKLS